MRDIVPGTIVRWPKASEEASSIVTVMIVARADAMKIDPELAWTPVIGGYAATINAAPSAVGLSLRFRQRPRRKDLLRQPDQPEQDKADRDQHDQPGKGLRDLEERGRERDEKAEPFFGGDEFSDHRAD